MEIINLKARSSLGLSGQGFKVNRRVRKQLTLQRPCIYALSSETILSCCGSSKYEELLDKLSHKSVTNIGDIIILKFLKEMAPPLTHITARWLGEITCFSKWVNYPFKISNICIQVKGYNCCARLTHIC